MSKIQIGTIVLYSLTEDEAMTINAVKAATTHIGSFAREGDLLPAIVTRIHTGQPKGEYEWERENRYNIRVFADGDQTPWLNGVKEGGDYGELRLPE